MARPKIDEEKFKQEILAAAERQLELSNGARLSITDIAKTLGVSQPYIHRFFASKSVLVKELARDWFKNVETLCQENAASSLPPQAKLKNHVQLILKIKRDKYDKNPDLFEAYLSLAKDHSDVVAIHVTKLRAILNYIIIEKLGEAAAVKFLPIFEDATAMFTSPHSIMIYRDRATDERANAVIDRLIKIKTAS